MRHEWNEPRIAEVMRQLNRERTQTEGPIKAVTDRSGLLLKLILQSNNVGNAQQIGWCLWREKN